MYCNESLMNPNLAFFPPPQHDRCRVADCTYDFLLTSFAKIL